MNETTALSAEANQVNRLSDDARRRLAQNIAKRWRKSTDAIKDLLEDANEALDFYLRNRPQQQDIGTGGADAYQAAAAGRRGQRLGHIFRTVSAMLATQHGATFPDDDRFFRGTPKNDAARENQEQYETYLAEMFATSHFTEEIWKHRLNCILAGTAVAAVRWERKEKRRVTYTQPTLEAFGVSIPIPFMPVQEKVEENYLCWEGTAIQALDFTDWRADPYANSWDDAWFIRRWYEPVWRVKKDYKRETVQSYHRQQDDYSTEDRKWTAMGIETPAWSLGKAEDQGKEEALLMVCYDDFVIDGEVYENHAALVLNDTDILWFGPNPYHHGMKPYVCTPYLPVPNSVYGISAIRHALPSAKVIDTATDKTLRIAAWAADPIILKNINDEGVKKNLTVKVRPGMTLPVTRPDAYQQLPINVSNVALLDVVMKAAEENIREVTATSTVTTGEDAPRSGVTAFEIDQRNQATSIRYQSVMSMFNNTTLEPLMMMAFENDRQFKTRDEWVAGFDDPLTPDMIKTMDFKWAITSTQATVNRGRDLANIKAFLFDMLPQLVQNGVVSLKQDTVGEVDPVQVLRLLLQKSGTRDADVLVQTREVEEVNNGLPGEIGPAAGGLGMPGLPPAALPPGGGTGAQPPVEGPGV